jgi:hypothetical protein
VKAAAETREDLVPDRSRETGDVIDSLHFVDKFDQ